MGGGGPQDASFDVHRAEESWKAWIDVAEEYLSGAYGLQRGVAKRGCEPIIRPCTLTGPQALNGDVTDHTVRKLEDIARGARRLNTLEMYGGEAVQKEVTALRAKLSNEDVAAAASSLEEARKALRKRRTQAWKDWVKGNLKSRARSIYAWAKRILPIEREEGLHWACDDCPAGVGVRIERGIHEWSQFWTSGAPAGWEKLRVRPSRPLL